MEDHPFGVPVAQHEDSAGPHPSTLFACVSGCSMVNKIWDYFFPRTSAQARLLGIAQNSEERNCLEDVKENTVVEPVDLLPALSPPGSKDARSPSVVSSRCSYPMLTTAASDITQFTESPHTVVSTATTATNPMESSPLISPNLPPPVHFYPKSKGQIRLLLLLVYVHLLVYVQRRCCLRKWVVSVVMKSTL
eukprot:GHVS01089825.1.p1 GENE.GHVS01089825.1~~GHVS01089825.1.p1  ORF type:complete len:192 (-),score=27.36 GHVS01089825.1:226-801(-)